MRDGLLPKGYDPDEVETDSSFYEESESIKPGILVLLVLLPPILVAGITMIILNQLPPPPDVPIEKLVLWKFGNQIMPFFAGMAAFLFTLLYMGIKGYLDV